LIIIILSHFDQIFGPKIVLNYPEVPDNLKFDHIPLLMDIYRTGFCIHKFGYLKTANRIFKVANPNARGKNEELMISVALVEENYNLKEFRNVLDIFMEKIQAVEDFHEGLYPTSPNYKESKFIEIRALVESFFQSLPKERDCFKLRSSRILVYGLPKVGISTLIQKLNTTYLDETMQIDEIRIARSIFGNLLITTFNFSGKDLINEVALSFFRGIEGLIFVLESSSIKGLEEEVKELHKITEFPDTKDLPLLILVNKSDITPIEVKEIRRELKVGELKNKCIEVYPISALNNEGIALAFSWLSLKILEARTFKS